MSSFSATRTVICRPHGTMPTQITISIRRSGKQEKQIRFCYRIAILKAGKLDTHSRRPNERSIHILTVLWGAWELCGNYMLNWNNFVDIQCSYPAPPFVNQIVSSSANNNLYLLAKNCQKIHYMSNATCYDKDKDNAERERTNERGSSHIQRTKGNNNKR